MIEINNYPWNKMQQNTIIKYNTQKTAQRLIHQKNNILKVQLSLKAKS